MTDEEDEQRTAAWLRQVELGGQGWEEWAKNSPLEWAKEEGLPVPVRQAIAEDLDIVWV